MLTNDIAIDDLNQASILQFSHDTPKCAPATTWLTTYRRRLGIDISIVATKTEQPQDYLSLGTSKLERTRQKSPDAIILFNKQPRRQYSLRLWHTITFLLSYYLNYSSTVGYYGILMVCHAVSQGLGFIGLTCIRASVIFVLRHFIPLGPRVLSAKWSETPWDFYFTTGQGIKINGTDVLIRKGGEP